MRYMTFFGAVAVVIVRDISPLLSPLALQREEVAESSRPVRGYCFYPISTHRPASHRARLRLATTLSRASGRGQGEGSPLLHPLRSARLKPHPHRHRPVIRSHALAHLRPLAHQPLHPHVVNPRARQQRPVETARGPPLRPRHAVPGVVAGGSGRGRGAQQEAGENEPAQAAGRQARPASSSVMREKNWSSIILDTPPSMR